MSAFIRVVALGGLWLGVFTACAAATEAPVLRIDGTSTTYALDQHVSLYVDAKPPLALDEVIRRDGFQMPEHESLMSGIRWYRFTVERVASAPAEWVLAFGEPDIDDVRLFAPLPDGKFLETQLGRRIPNQDLEVAARRHMARLSLPEGKPATFYLRLESAHKIRFEEAALWRPEALIFDEAREVARYGIHLGVLAALVVGYVLFGALGHDRPMLFYALYISTIMARALSHTGMITLLVPSAAAETNNFLSVFGLVGGGAVFVFMWDSILSLKQVRPRMHRLYTIMAWTLVLMGIPAATRLLPGPLFMLVQLIMLAVSVTSAVLAVQMMKRSTDTSLLKFYLAAFLPIIAVGAIQLASARWPLVPIGLGRDMNRVSTALHIGILAFALAHRLRRLHHERVRIRQELAGERQMQQHLRAFIEMATHEFKTPLAVIDSSAQVMKKLASGQPEIASRTDIIRLSVKRLVGLIETCLASERCATMNIEPAPVSPFAIVEQAAARNRLPDGPAITVTALQEAQLPGQIMVDGALLGIALDALIDNARRYGPVGQTIDITVQPLDQRIAFGVHDRGAGVPPEEAGRIFEQYYRCAATASVSGTGIGLHVVKTIAELHGGKAGYAPRRGGGSSFTVALPYRPNVIGVRDAHSSDHQASTATFSVN